MKKQVVALFLLSMFLAPASSFAATTKLQYAGWLPFWEKQGGAIDSAINLDKLSEVSPFSYEVNASRGTLIDDLKIHDGFWQGWFSGVRALKVKIVPTIAWFDGDEIHALLSDTKKRQAHEDIIAKLVQDEKFDGIDIDYEGKMSATKDYFSTFLKGMALRLHPKKKILSCTVEARMPLTSLYAEVPKVPKYANDYAAINKYCDEVRIMTYDQGTIDLKLNVTKGNGTLYAPVSDSDWVEKVIKETIKTINPKKIMLGVPTYGYEYQVNWENGVTTYRRLRSVNFFTAMNAADREGITPVRNNAGELSFTYASSTFVEVSGLRRTTVSSTVAPPEITAIIAKNASAVTRFVSFPDAESIAQKVKLARKYGLRGVALFKLDAQFDPLLWDQLK